MKHELTAKRLKQAMALANMKAQELADRSGVSKVSISQYVNGTHAPSNISAGKMAAVLDVDPVWLIGFDVPMRRKTDDEPAYYFDPDTAAKAQELFENPNLRILFSAARYAKPEDLQMAADLLMRLKGVHPDEQ